MIEHKSVSDFISSVRSGKLDSQLTDLKKNGFPYIALFIDGKWHEGWTAHKGRPFTANERYAKIEAIAVRDRIPVLEFPSEERLVAAVINLPHLIERKNGVDPSVVERGTCAAVKGHDNLAAYLHLRGVGLDKAREMEHRYGPFLHFLAHYRATRDALKAEKVNKKQFFEYFPKGLVTKKTRESLDDLCYESGEKPEPLL